MEGDFAFKKWCRAKGYPASYIELQRESNIADIKLLDERWEQICQEYEKDSFRNSKSSVITPASFGPHIRRVRVRKGV